MNPLPQAVWHALIALQTACAAQGIPLRGVSMLNVDPVVFATPLGELEVMRFMSVYEFERGRHRARFDPEGL